MNLKKIVKTLNFESLDDDMFAETFSKKQIRKDFIHEDAIANPLEELPEDYRWYLENYGSRTLRDMEYQVQVDKDTTYIASFEGLANPSGACQKYRYHTCTGSYAYRLKEDEVYILDAKFLPITSESDGKMLVLDMKDKVGSIWQFPSEEDCSKYDLKYEPSLVADNLASFLSLLKPSQWSSYFKETLLSEGYKETEELSNVFKKNILTDKELLYQCIESYEKNVSANFIEFSDAATFLDLLSTAPEKIIINAPRAVELHYLSFGGSWQAKNETELKNNIEKIQNLKSNLNIKRKNHSAETIEQHTTSGYGYLGTNHNFYEITVKSSINGLQHEEDFVFYKNPSTQLLSFVRIAQIRIENIEIKGIGIFEYDFYWSSIESIKIKWSPISATINLKAPFEDFTEAYYAFMRQTIDDDSFKEKLEQFIFDHYQKNDYPEFVEMTETDKEFFEDAYPKISTPSEVWKVLGEAFDIHFIDHQTFDLQFEYGPDDEHGLAINCVNRKFKLATS